MKVVACRCGCPHNMHSRKPPYVCYLTTDGTEPHDCAGWFPAVKQVSVATVATANKERGA